MLAGYMGDAMNIVEKKQGSVTVSQLTGRLDAGSAPSVDAGLGAVVAGGCRQMVVDLSDVEYVSSAGLRALLTAAKKMQQAEGRLVLAAASPQVHAVLEVAGFAAIIPVFDTVSQACASLAPASEPLVTAPCPLTIAEEIYLMALDDHQGVIKPMPAFALDYALAGALLMELELVNRIDSDLTTLKVIASEKTADPLLDETLETLRASAVPQPTAYWLKQFADQSMRIEKRVLESLVRKGVLRQENRRILWVFEVRRYPVIDDREVKEVCSRLRQLIAGDAIPDPRDVVLICLGSACRLLDDLFSADEFERLKPRIAALARLDLIGHEMFEAIREIERAMVEMSIPLM